MENFNLHIAINARGLCSRKDFSLLLWQRAAAKKLLVPLNLHQFRELSHRLNLIHVTKYN